MQMNDHEETADKH